MPNVDQSDLARQALFLVLRHTEKAGRIGIMPHSLHPRTVQDIQSQGHLLGSLLSCLSMANTGLYQNKVARFCPPVIKVLSVEPPIVHVRSFAETIFSQEEALDLLEIAKRARRDRKEIAEMMGTSWGKVGEENAVAKSKAWTEDEAKFVVWDKVLALVRGHSVWELKKRDNKKDLNFTQPVGSLFSFFILYFSFKWTGATQKVKLPLAKSGMNHF